MSKRFKNKNKGQHKKFSEDEIKNKLYGGLKPSEESPEPKERRVEAKIQQKLYGNVRTPEEEPEPQEEKTLFAQPAKGTEPERKETHSADSVKRDKDALQVKKDKLLKEESKVRQRIMEELSLLKGTISELEDRLRKSEEQKERIKRKFLQRKRVDLIAARAIKPLQERGNEKMFILIPAVIIIVLLLVIMTMRSQIKQTTAPAESGQPDAVSVPLASASQPKPKPSAAAPAAVSTSSVAPLQPASTKEYTIQVAEYGQKDAADRFIETLKAQGFDVYVNTTYRNNDKTKPYFKVMVGRFSTFDAAKKFNEQFQGKSGIKDSFIREKR